MAFLIVEKKNHNAVHGIFDTLDRADNHLQNVIPVYCQRGYYMNKSLKADDFEVINNG